MSSRRRGRGEKFPKQTEGTTWDAFLTGSCVFLSFSFPSSSSSSCFISLDIFFVHLAVQFL